jgi:hypothetical protein
MIGKIKIIIKAPKIELNAELFDTHTGKKVWDLLPVTSSVRTWGEEIYFAIPLTQALESDARADVEVGEIGYWDVGKSMCVFWGRTPASKGEQPVAASPVNIFGKVLDDPKVLDAAHDGDEILVEKIV